MTTSDPAEEKSDPVDRLKPREAKLVLELLNGHTLAKAAERAGVSQASAKRWKKRPAVREALEAAQQESMQELSRLLAAWDREAVAVLVQLMGDKTTPPATRRASANQLLQRRLQIATLAELERRVQLLEDASGDDAGDRWRWNG